MSAIKATKQTQKNFYFNLLALIVNIIIGLYYTPYLVNELGLSAYGIVPIALIINQYISIATGTLTSAYTRFYSIDLQKGNYIQASKDISTSIFVVISIIVFCIPFLIYLILDINTFFDIPEQYLQSAKLLFIFTICSFFISLFSSLLNVTLYALNRLDIITSLNIIRNVFKFILVIILFETVSIKVSYIGISSFIIEVLILIISSYFFRHYKPNEVKISWSNYDKSILFAILGMSVWVLVQQIGDTFIYRSDNLIINHFWGTVASGAVGVVSEFGGYIRIIVSVIGSLFGPLIIHAYSKNNHSEVKRLTLQQSLIVGCLSSVLSGLCSGFGEQLLDLWINPEFGKYKWWLLIKLIVIPFYASGGILAYIYRTWNKVRLPALLTIILGFFNIAIIIVISNLFTQESTITTVLIITSAISFLQCYIVNCLCVKLIYKDTLQSLIRNSFKIIISFFFSYLLSSLISLIITPTSLISLLLLGIFCLALCILFICLALFSKSDRIAFFSLFYKK